MGEAAAHAPSSTAGARRERTRSTEARYGAGGFRDVTVRARQRCIFYRRDPLKGSALNLSASMLRGLQCGRTMRRRDA